MQAREVEDKMLQVCLDLAQARTMRVHNESQANAAHFLALLLGESGGVTSTRLENAAQVFFKENVTSPKSFQEMLKEPWLLGVSRFKDMFTKNLEFATQMELKKRELS